MENNELSLSRMPWYCVEGMFNLTSNSEYSNPDSPSAGKICGFIGPESILKEEVSLLKIVGSNTYGRRRKWI
jgi:hypothetical protein